MAEHKKKGKDAIKRDKQIAEIRAKFGKPPLGSQKTYKERLEEHENRKK